MTTDRGRMQALKQLVEHQQAGGYTLPADVLKAYNLPQQVQALPLPQPDALAVDAAGAQVIAALGRDAVPDLAALARRMQDADASRNRYALAQRVQVEAAQQAQNQALSVGYDHADRIITTCLRDAHAAVLDTARRDAAALAGHDPADTRALVTAPTKVRTAWHNLHTTAEQYGTLRQAREWANTVGMRQPEHDEAGQFATFRDPRALFPDLPSTAPLPPMPRFDDPLARLLWVVADGAAAEPWLPTTHEQDARWWDVYGQGVQNRRTGQALAAHVGARGPASAA